MADATNSPPSPRSTRLLLATCFLLSGGAALVYEVLWSRHLHLLFGSTTESVAVVLAVFMAGLGLGGHMLGRVVDRSASPMRLYALMEVGVGLYALATPPLLALARALYGVCATSLAPGGVAQALVKLALAALVLLPPATLMGGTLPALVRATAASGAEARHQVGLLYALNTLGAVAGTLLTGLVLIETVGLAASMHLTAVVNLGVGLLVLARAKRVGAQPLDAAVGAPGSALRALLGSGIGRYALLGLFISGVTTMVAEIVFTRVLALVFGVSSYAFSLVLATFLTGLGLGAMVAHAWARRRVPHAADFGMTQVAVGILGAGMLAAIPLVPRAVLLARQIPELGFWQLLGLKGLIAALLLVPFALVAGLGTPLLLAALASDLRRLGRVVGDAYMVNTAGTIAGSLAGGFLLVPALGTQGALVCATLASLGVGLVGLIPRSLAANAGAGVRWVGVGLGVAAAVAALGARRWPAATFLLSDTRAYQEMARTRLAFEQRLAASPGELLYFAEGREATVAVLAFKEARSLLVNGHPDASDHDDMATQLMLGVIPILAHPAPADVMVIGFGSGVTATGVAHAPELRSLDVVELEPAVLAAAPYFHHVNRAIEDDPRVHLIADDARSYVASTDKRYDLIVSEPSNPWRTGVATLFTQEFYQTARSRLKPGGLFAQWVQLYGLSPRTMRMIFRTLSRSFPELQVWWMDPGNTLVIGSDQPLRLDRARVERLLETRVLRDQVRRYASIKRSAEIYARLLLDTAAVRAFVGAGGEEDIHTDDLPLLEFEAPRGLFLNDGQNKLRLLSAKFTDPKRPGGPPRILLPQATGEPLPLAYFWSGTAWMYHAIERPREARVAMQQALRLDRSPYQLVRAAEIALTEGDFKNAEAMLGALDKGAVARSAEEQTEATEVLVRLRVKQQRYAEALDGFARLGAPSASGVLDGRLGVERLKALVGVRQIDAAVAQAERCLKSARLGESLDGEDVSVVYVSLIELVRQGADAKRLAALVEANPGVGYPRFPRERALTLLYAQAGRYADVAMHARLARESGALDPGMFELEGHALFELGRGAEATSVLEELHRLMPTALRERIPSPLLGEVAAQPDAVEEAQ